MKTLIRWLPLAIAALLGLTAGLGAYTFGYARGASYLTNDPAACANCHIMGEHYGAWLKSSHRAVAVCNDCHAPKGLIGKYYVKASNGFWHSVRFTTGVFPDPLTIRPVNRAVTEATCRQCHGAMVDAVDAHASQDASCVRCHLHVGHWVR